MKNKKKWTNKQVNYLKLWKKTPEKQMQDWKSRTELKKTKKVEENK